MRDWRRAARGARDPKGSQKQIPGNLSGVLEGLPTLHLMKNKTMPNFRYGCRIWIHFNVLALVRDSELPDAGSDVAQGIRSSTSFCPLAVANAKILKGL